MAVNDDPNKHWVYNKETGKVELQSGYTAGDTIMQKGFTIDSHDSDSLQIWSDWPNEYTLRYPNDYNSFTSDSGISLDDSVKILDLEQKIEKLKKVIEEAEMLFSTCEPSGKEGIGGLWERYLDEWRRLKQEALDTEESMVDKVSLDEIVKAEDVNAVILKDMEVNTCGYIDPLYIAFGKDRNPFKMTRPLYIDPEGLVIDVVSEKKPSFFLENSPYKKDKIRVFKSDAGVGIVFDDLNNLSFKYDLEANYKSSMIKLKTKVTEEYIDARRQRR